eukprot:Unigene1207_Nuclearia_a/m.3853 Unigene1207_Nuclearia_a/g.3853  ORF Unigene1207_Nuclearia_a/g.3853 Unigene1207_Nuclearia_a/m.3853 type:complete len:165 (-) Unigene1207_Nuclearia_a:54-548(-)
MAPKAGDRAPDVPLLLDAESHTTTLAALTAGGRGVFFAVPGAFTPTCHKQHLPGYVRDYEQIKAHGVSVIGCISVNDPWVMDAWNEAGGGVGKITMLCDPTAAFTRALGEDVLLQSPMLGTRSRRYAVIVDDGVISAFALEEPGKLECSRSTDVLQLLEAHKGA